VEAALLRHFGNVTFAADDLDMPSASLSKRIRENPKLEEAKRWGEATLIHGCARLMAHEALNLKNWKAAKFILERKGRDEGWGVTNRLNKNDIEYLVTEVVSAMGSSTSAIEQFASAVDVEIPRKLAGNRKASGEAARGCGEARSEQRRGGYCGVYGEMRRLGLFAKPGPGAYAVLYSRN